MGAAKETCTFRLSEQWILEIEMNLKDSVTGKEYSVPILLHGCDVAIEASDLFKNLTCAQTFCERISAKVNELATKKLESGQVGKRP